MKIEAARDGSSMQLLDGGITASDTTYLELPAPPSVNAMFRNHARGRVATKAYTDWQGHAGWVLRSQHPRKIGGRVVLAISIERLSANADIDNRIKAIADLLVKHDVIDDDRNVTAILACWSPAANKIARVQIMRASDFTAEFHATPDGSAGGWFVSLPQQEAI